MLAVNLKGYLVDLIKKADEPGDIEIKINGTEILNIEYIKRIDGDSESEEFIDIIA